MSGEATVETSPAVLVTGATGAVGPALVAEIAKSGASVRVLCRRPPPPGLLPAMVEVHVGDVLKPGDVAGAMRGISQVFHLASRLHVANPDPSLRDDYEALNVGGTRHVLEAARSLGARVVYFSSIVVYGPTHGTPVDEASPIRPSGLYAETKYRAEEVVQSSGVPSTILRLAAVYGPRMKGNYRRLTDALRRGRFVPIGHGENRRTLIHEFDAARAAVLVSQRPESIGHIFNVTDGQLHPMRQIIAAVCAALGRREPTWHVSEALARFLTGAADATGSVFGRRGGYRNLLDKYVESVEVNGEKIQDRLGFRPTFDLESGWRDAMAESSELGR